MAGNNFQLNVNTRVKGRRELTKLGNSFQGVQGKAKNLLLTIRSLAGPFATIFATYKAVGFVANSFTVMAERASDMKVLASSLSTITADAPKTAKSLKELADSLGYKTLFDERDFIKGFNLLTSFRTIGVDSYERVTIAAADMATKLGTDVRSNLLQLAKALEAPEVGLTALRRSGTRFTEEQTNLIKSLVDSGRLLEAQKLILEEIESQYGGAAFAAAQGFAASLDTLRQRARDLQEELGRLLDPLATPAVEGLSDLMESATNGIKYMLSNLPQVFTWTTRLLKVTSIYASVWAGIAAAKSLGAILKGAKLLLDMEKAKLAIVKSRAAIEATLAAIAATPGLWTKILAGGTVAAGAYVVLDKVINDTMASVEGLYSEFDNLNGQLVSAGEGLTEKTEEIVNNWKMVKDSIKGGMQEYAKSIGDTAGQVKGATVNAFKGMENQLVSFVTTGKFSFKSLAKSIIADLARIAIRAMILKPLMAGFGIKGFAKGGVFENGNQITAYAKGGVVNRPTMFAMGGAGNFGIMGEGGNPEAILPLKRRNGVLGVEGGGNSNNVVVNVNAQGTNVQGDEEEGKMLGKLIAAAVQSTLIKEQRPGGLLAA